jgi:hypothetical protein
MDGWSGAGFGGMKNMTKEMQRIGIDIGRVIIGPVIHGREDTSFLGSRLEDALETPPAEGAIEGVAELVERSGGAGVADLEVRARGAGQDARVARAPRRSGGAPGWTAATCGSA